MYSKKTMDLFMHPHNMGEIKDADGVGKVGNPICGDVLELFIKVEDDKITGIKFKTFGCAAAIATSSMITDLVKGNTVEDALKVTNQDVARELGGLPPIKMHCSVLAAEALKEAVYDYLKKSNKPVPPELEAAHARIMRGEGAH